MTIASVLLSIITILFTYSAAHFFLFIATFYTVVLAAFSRFLTARYIFFIFWFVLSPSPPTVSEDKVPCEVGIHAHLHIVFQLGNINQEGKGGSP